MLPTLQPANSQSLWGGSLPPAIIWWNIWCSGFFLRRLTWWHYPVDGQGGFCPLSQSEWARRGLLFFLPDWAGGLGTRRWSLVRKSFPEAFTTSDIVLGWVEATYFSSVYFIDSRFGWLLNRKNIPLHICYFVPGLNMWSAARTVASSPRIKTSPSWLCVNIIWWNRRGWRSSM